MADEVAAALADIRMQAEDHHLVPAADAYRLLAVVDAVLRRHRFSDLGGPHCVNCSFAWPCPTRDDISRALLGKEADHGDGG